LNYGFDIGAMELIWIMVLNFLRQ